MVAACVVYYVNQDTRRHMQQDIANEFGVSTAAMRETWTQIEESVPRHQLNEIRLDPGM